MRDARNARRLAALVAAALPALAFAQETADEAVARGVSGALEHLAERWQMLLVAAALVGVAWFVNRFAPKRRRRVRRTLLLFGLYILAQALASATKTHHPAWFQRFVFGADLAEAYTVLNLVAIAVFDLALPAVRMEPVAITSDLLVGVGYIVSTIAVLHAVGMDFSSVVTTSAIVSGVIALSLQATLGNILGGVALQLDESIHVNDWIVLPDGKQGRVQEIRWRHTVVETRDWNTIVVPNASLLASNITILGKRAGQPSQYRMWVYFNVDFRHPPARVIQIVQDALCAAPIPGVAAEPLPNCVVMDFAKDGRDSFGYFAVRYWLTDFAKDDPTSSLVRARIYTALRRAGIPLARPSQTVFTTPDDDAENRRREDRHREKRLAALKDIDLFQKLTSEELDYLAEHLQYAPFTAGETITRQGAVAHWLYMIVSGEAEVRTRSAGESKAVTSLAAPSFFGEMELMTGEPRAADLVAVAECECYRLDKEAFSKIVQERPEVAESVSQTLAHRRVAIEAAREGLDAEAQKSREAREQARILGRIRSFFGLED